MTTTQTKVMAAVDPIARRLGYYTAYELDKLEYIGYREDVATGTRNELLNNGYERSPTIAGIRLQAAKKHPETGEIHEYSLRKVDPNDNRRQYHVHLWGGGVTSIYSHHEFRPDLRVLEGESLEDAKERLQTHYRPEWGETYIRGKACEVVESLV